MNSAIPALVRRWRVIQSPLFQAIRFNQSNPNSIALKHRPTPLEKKFLVWTGKYKKVEDIPETVSHETIHKAKSKARIRIANYMILTTILACVAMVISGKKAAERGESVQGYNLDWHKKIREDHENEMKKSNK